MLTDHPTDSSALPDSPPHTPWLLPLSLADQQVSCIEVHLVAHFQEMPQVLLSEKQVDGDTTPTGGLHEVTEELHVGEHIHHHSHHLREGGKAQPSLGAGAGA